VRGNVRNGIELAVNGRVIRQHIGHVLLVVEEVRIEVGRRDRQAAVEQIGLGADLEALAGFRLDREGR
jgi:hypothetical protein